MGDDRGGGGNRRATSKTSRWVVYQSQQLGTTSIAYLFWALILGLLGCLLASVQIYRLPLHLVLQRPAPQKNVKSGLAAFIVRGEQGGPLLLYSLA